MTSDPKVSPQALAATQLFAGLPAAVLEVVAAAARRRRRLTIRNPAELLRIAEEATD